MAGKNGQGPAVKRARSHFSPGTLPVQSKVQCCLTHFPPARSQPKNSTLPVRRSSPSAEPSPASPVIHLLRPSLLRLRPPFTSFGRTPSGFARHSRLGREAGHTIRQAGKVAGKNGQGLSGKRARSHFKPGTLPVQSKVACCLAHFPPARSQPKNSTLPVRRSSPSAAPLPVSPVIHPLRPHLPFCSSFTPFGRASRFARHSPPSAAPLVSPVIHPLRPHLFRFRSSFTPFGRTSSGFARHSPPSAAPLPVSSVIPGLTGNLLRGFSVSRNCLFLQSG